MGGVVHVGRGDGPDSQPQVHPWLNVKKLDKLRRVEWVVGVVHVVLTARLRFAQGCFEKCKGELRKGEKTVKKLATNKKVKTS